MPACDRPIPERRDPVFDPHRVSADSRADAAFCRWPGGGMPVLADLFELFSPSCRASRAVPGLVVGNLPDFPLSSMGGQWL
jgi:hypothetical protein